MVVLIIGFSPVQATKQYPEEIGEFTEYFLSILS